MKKVLHKKADLKRPFILIAAVITIAFSCCCFVSQKNEALANLNLSTGVDSFPNCLKGCGYTSILCDQNVTSAFNEAEWGSTMIQGFVSSPELHLIDDQCKGLSAAFRASVSANYGIVNFILDHWSYNIYNDYKSTWVPYVSQVGQNNYEARAVYKFDSSYTDLRRCYKSGWLNPSADIDVFRANYAHLIPFDIEGDGSRTDSGNKYLFIYNANTGDDLQKGPDDLDIKYYSYIKPIVSGQYKIGLKNEDGKNSKNYSKNKEISFNVQANEGYIFTGFYVVNQLDDMEKSDIFVPVDGEDWISSSAIDIDNPKIVAVFEQIPESIEVTSMPWKTSYNVGDKFDPAGMVVTAYYEDEEPKTQLERLMGISNSKDITKSVTWTPETFTNAGEQKVTISYKVGNVNKNAYVPVNVSEVFPTPTPTPITDPSSSANNFSNCQSIDVVDTQAPQTDDINIVYTLLGIAAASLCIVVICARRRIVTMVYGIYRSTSFKNITKWSKIK